MRGVKLCPSGRPPGCARGRRTPRRPSSPADEVRHDDAAGELGRRVGSTARSMAPSRRWICQSSGLGMTRRSREDAAWRGQPWPKAEMPPWAEDHVAAHAGSFDLLSVADRRCPPPWRLPARPTTWSGHASSGRVPSAARRCREDVVVEQHEAMLDRGPRLAQGGAEVDLAAPVGRQSSTSRSWRRPQSHPRCARCAEALGLFPDVLHRQGETVRDPGSEGNARGLAASDVRQRFVSDLLHDGRHGEVRQRRTQPGKGDDLPAIRIDRARQPEELEGLALVEMDGPISRNILAASRAISFRSIGK